MNIEEINRKKNGDSEINHILNSLGLIILTEVEVCSSIEVAGSIISLFSVLDFWIGWEGIKNWNITIIAIDKPIAKNKFFCSIIILYFAFF